MGHSEGSPGREVHLKMTEIFQINNITLHLQELEEQQQTKPRARRRNKTTKIRAELNNIQIKSTILGSISPGADPLKDKQN